MTELELKAKLYTKLLNVKKQITYLRKENKGFNFDYVGPEAVLSAINPLLNEEGVMLTTSVVESIPQRIVSKPKYFELVRYESGKKVVEHVMRDVEETLFHLKLVFTWVDTETGYSVDIPFEASGINNDEQGVGSAMTYAERYFLLKQFNIATGKDDPDALGVNRLADKGEKPPIKLAGADAKWITDAQVQEAVSQIMSGEEGVYEKVLGTYKISKVNKAKLELALEKVGSQEVAEETPKEAPKETPKKVEKKSPPKPREDVKKVAPETTPGSVSHGLAPNPEFDISANEEVDKQRKEKAREFFKSYDEAELLKFLIKNEKLRFTRVDDFVDNTGLTELYEVGNRVKEYFTK